MRNDQDTWSDRLGHDFSSSSHAVHAVPVFCQIKHKLILVTHRRTEYSHHHVMSASGSTLIPNQPQLLKRSFYHFGTLMKIKTNRKLYSIRTNYYWTNFYDYIPHLREVPFNHRQFTSQWSEKFSLIVLNSSISHIYSIILTFYLTNLILVLTWIWIPISSHHKTSNQMEAIPWNRAREIFINISF